MKYLSSGCAYCHSGGDMQLQSYLMCAEGQILRKKAEPNHQQVADDRFCYSQSCYTHSLAAFVDPIHVNNEKER